MAKYEDRLNGDFDELLKRLDNGILRGSASAALKDGSDYYSNNTRCAVRVYERFSMMGGTKVNLSLTLIGSNRDLFISAITSGGAQITHAAVGTLGESSFLQHAVDIIEDYKMELE